jgi:aminomethyltransferase
MAESATLNITPLHDAHVRLKARLVPFAGFDMPVQYTGIIAEAKAVRTSCGMFDVSHMGRLGIAGEDSLAFLERVTTNDVSKLTPMSGQYSLLPNDRGGCVDDIILYRLDSGFQMVVNASNHAKALAWLKSHVTGDVCIDDVTDQTCMIAVQGPLSVQILSELGGFGGTLSSMPTFGVVRVTVNGILIQAARSGYTGEDGFELICGAEDAERVWDLLLDAGVTPCGLGARDTLRVEAGLPLYGHELSDEISPIAAGLGWVVSKTKSFIGSDEMNRVRDAGPSQRLVGIRLGLKRLISPGTEVLVDGQSVGAVTSGIVSPTLDTALALAYVDASVRFGTECSLDLRGKLESGIVVNKRFYKRVLI